MTFTPSSCNFLIPNKPQLAHGHFAGENQKIRVVGGYAVIV
jgi:hypothetical protein